MGLFKAYDVRGVVPDQLNPDMAFRIGWAFARHLGEETHQPLVAVGMDARPSSPAITQAFCDGLLAGDAKVEFVGPCSTPMLYFAVAGREVKCHGGAMITASHNPARYNGIKFCREDAIPIANNTGLADIEALCASAPEPQRPYRSELTVTLSGNHADVPAPLGFDARLWEGYMAHLRRFVRRMPEGLHVAVDTANGMGGAYLGFLRSLGLKVHTLNGEFDGTFPNHEANPSKLDNLKPLMALSRDMGCNLGIAFDGDADRAVFIDHSATPVGQDMVTALLGVETLRRNKGGAVLYDLRSSRAVAEAIEAAGGRAVRERVGHSFMKQTMRKVGCVVGGELAGHYYFKDNFYADSAIIAVIEILNAMGRSGEPLAELIKPLRKYVQTGEVNFRVDDAEALFAKVQDQFKGGKIDTLDGITVQYPDWWFNLRASNTEPYVRLNLEASTTEQLREKFDQLTALLGKIED
ncbi:MAG: phosphomannomutase/phosphoglucomutase [Planctomycetes bacterium]|nr:phosphomannomutase/phosphoglucomutase [Planctomycetota bacterium]